MGEGHVNMEFTCGDRVRRKGKHIIQSRKSLYARRLGNGDVIESVKTGS